MTTTNISSLVKKPRKRRRVYEIVSRKEGVEHQGLNAAEPHITELTPHELNSYISERKEEIRNYYKQLRMRSGRP